MRIINLTFKRADILYDIENYAFVEGDILNADDENKKHLIVDIGQSGNIDRVTRVLNLAYSESVEMLFPYTKESIMKPCECECVNLVAYPEDIIVPTDVYSIRLVLPDTFSVSTVRLITNLIHEYFVCRVMADWMSIVNPESMSNWQRKTYELKEKLQTCLLSRTKKVKRKSSKF